MRRQSAAVKSGGVAGGLPGGWTGWLLGRLLSRVRAGRRAAPRLALVERITLAPRQSLALVEAEGRRILVATSADGASAFYPLDEAGGRSGRPTAPAPGSDLSTRARSVSGNVSSGTSARVAPALSSRRSW
ncbi:MAG TPA: flagellar biosynthetic protein FliO [Terracidiphilus sp.]|nr:flagellar biosynthetic protein FliO [Terracidiphilus sp.]